MRRESGLTNRDPLLYLCNHATNHAFTGRITTHVVCIMEQFVETQLSLIALEREAELAEGLSLVSKGIKNVKELQERGICLTRLGVASQRVGLYGRQLVTFESARGHVKTLPVNWLSSGETENEDN